jgi:D-arginine dehydrogenase
MREAGYTRLHRSGSPRSQRTVTQQRAEVVVVGAGIAGASLAYVLAEAGMTDVVVLEREAQPGTHATGRSAATLVEIDPIPTLQRLKMVGARFFHAQPAGFSEHEVLERRGVLALFDDPLWSVMRDRARVGADLATQPLEPAAASARVGGLLDTSSFDGAAWFPDDGYLDVHELLQSYMRHARRRGVRFRTGCEVRGIERTGGRCAGVVTADGTIAARWVVNAAGAWVEQVAAFAAAMPIAFAPLRRSAVVFPAPDGVDTATWPLVWSEPHHLYFRAEPTGLLFSPMDETPQPPSDVHADDDMVAEGLERLRTLAPALVPRTLSRRWAGLRTFSPDRVPVVGEDPTLPGFFWLAGQGGCGIETSPAVGRIAAELLLEGRTEVFDASLLAPGRFG